MAPKDELPKVVLGILAASNVGPANVDDEEKLPKIGALGFSALLPNRKPPTKEKNSR